MNTKKKTRYGVEGRDQFGGIIINEQQQLRGNNIDEENASIHDLCWILIASQKSLH